MLLNFGGQQVGGAGGFGPPGLLPHKNTLGCPMLTMTKQFQGTQPFAQREAQRFVLRQVSHK
jgi:hypothetical protein